MDAAAEWARAQARVIEVVRGLSEAEIETRVPACPAWSVKDLLAHMVGLDADVLAGDEPDDHNSAWTQRQVDERAGRELAAVVEEWSTMTGAMQAWMGEHGARPLGDVVIHEQDMRSAVGVPGARDSDGLAAIRDRMAEAFAGRVRDAGLPAISLEGPGWQFAAGDGTPAVVVAGPDFDLARALMSRRTAAQVRGWTVRGDVEAYLPLFSGLGPLPEAELPE